MASSPHSEELKQSLIEACGEPGASVAGVALANGINFNQLRRWMLERGIQPPESATFFTRRCGCLAEMRDLTEK